MTLSSVTSAVVRLILFSCGPRVPSEIREWAPDSTPLPVIIVVDWVAAVPAGDVCLSLAVCSSGTLCGESLRDPC